MTQSAFPPWIRRAWPSGEGLRVVKDLLDGMGVHTVCQSAHCPNQGECWSRRTATMMILGNLCTRHCRFCAVNSGRPAGVDPEEPRNVAEAAARLQLRHVVLTSVNRDDLADGGAACFADTVFALKARLPGTTVEVLTPDFAGSPEAIQRVLDAGPAVFSHNIETVERLHPVLRDRRFAYRASLDVLRIAAGYGQGVFVKSALMLGCGETEEELRRGLIDLREAGATAVSMGQYLQPTRKHYPVAAYLSPAAFAAYEKMAYDLGFTFAVAGPFVRSSYRAEELFQRPAVATGGH